MPDNPRISDGELEEVRAHAPGEMTTKTTSVYGPPDKGAVEQIERCMEDESALAGCLMADHHLGYAMPIGGVIAYDGFISPSGVGYDIACGNKAVRLDMDGGSLRKDIDGIMDRVFDQISFGVGRVNKEGVDHEVFDHNAWRLVEDLGIKTPHCRDLKQLARQQLGTIGSGNHYVDLFTDEQDYLPPSRFLNEIGFGLE